MVTLWQHVMVSFCHLFVLPCSSESGEREVDSAGIENPWHTTLGPQGVEFVTPCQLRSSVNSYLKHSFMQHVPQRSQCLNRLSPVIQVLRWRSNQEKEISAVMIAEFTVQSAIPLYQYKLFLSLSTNHTNLSHLPSVWECGQHLSEFSFLTVQHSVHLLVVVREVLQEIQPMKCTLHNTPSNTLGATQDVNRYNTNKYYVAMEKAGSISYNLIKYQ